MRGKSRKFTTNKNIHLLNRVHDLNEDLETTSLSRNLAENKYKLKKIYNNCADVIFRSFTIGGQTEALVIYIEGLASVYEINENVLQPLMPKKEPMTQDIESFIEESLNISEINKVSTLEA